MRILFMGSPAEVVVCLQALVKHCESSSADQFIGVVSQPARPAGRKGVLTDPPVAAYAKGQGWPLWQPEKAKDPEFLSQLRNLNPDIIVTAAYGQILSDEFLSIPRIATINIHPSLLPLYRGATPIQTALLHGDRHTGVCILYTVKALDAGDIISTQTITIEPHETTGSLLPRAFAVGSEMLPDALNKLRTEGFKGQEQDENKVSFCKKITKQDGFLNLDCAANVALNRFRAYDPWPGTYTFFGDRRVVITEMTVIEDLGKEADTGKVFYDKSHGGIVVPVTVGALVLKRLKPAGGKEMDAASFWNGLKVNDPISLPVALDR